MATSDELRETGREIQGTLWPATRNSPGGQFPAAKLAPDYFDWVQQTTFGMIWSRPALPLRDRSMITIAMLAALGHHEELRGHLAGGLAAGLSPAELVEVLMQVGVYAGVPAGVAALRTAADVLPVPD